MKIQFMLLRLRTVFKSQNCLLKVAALVLLFSSSVARSASLEVTLSDGEGNPVSDAVIEILLPETLKASYELKENLRVDQIDKEFVPHVSTVVAGNYVSFPNSDDILHHVYSFSPINTFNIPLYGKDDSDRFQQLFAETGVIEIGCNIHDWMLAYIYVAESSLSSISNEAGLAKIEEAPVGQFSLRIWHPRLAEGDAGVLLTVNLEDQKITQQTTVLDLVRDRRIRRAPSANRNRYR